MASGILKWWDNKKGFGFICRKPGEVDVFVHHKDVVGDGFKTLRQGDEVTYELIFSTKGPKAGNVQKVARPDPRR